MHHLVLVIRLALTVVFGVAATAKLRDLDAFADSVVAFGTPLRLARHVSRAVPALELATAIALLPQASARWGAAVAAAMLLLFIGVIGRALSQGLTPNCNCFGQLTAEQISWRTLARNIVLLLGAGIAVWLAPGASLSAWTTNIDAANLVAGLACLVAVLSIVLNVGYAQRLRLAASGSPTAGAGADAGAPPLDIGDRAPAFELPALDGTPVSLDALLEPGRPVLLVFASPTCAPCGALLPEIVRWSAALGERITFAVVESGVSDPAATAAMLGDVGELTVLVEPERELAERFLVQGTPTGVAVDADGRIARPMAPGAGGIERLIRTIMREGATAPQAPAVAAS